MMTVMVFVMPGRAPPTMPTNVPTASGARYFHWRTLIRPSRSSSYTTSSEVGPAPARQQNREVILEQVERCERRHERNGQCDAPGFHVARRLEQPLQGEHEEECGDPEAEQGNESSVDSEDDEAPRHETVVGARPRFRGLLLPR